jgi:hypothetical protein
MSLETAQKVIVPQKKNYVPHFLKQRDINSYSKIANPQMCHFIDLSFADTFIFWSLKIQVFSLS